MLKRKRIRQRGKLSLSKYFQTFSAGDSVALVTDLTVQSPGFPKRMHGRTGTITGQRGRAYTVDVNDYNKKKTYMVHPVHLKKIQQAGAAQ